MWSGVLRERSFSKCVCSMSMIRGGCVVISLVDGLGHIWFQVWVGL